MKPIITALATVVLLYTSPAFAQPKQSEQRLPPSPQNTQISAQAVKLQGYLTNIADLINEVVKDFTAASPGLLTATSINATNATMSVDASSSTVTVVAPVTQLMTDRDPKVKANPGIIGLIGAYQASGIPTGFYLLKLNQDSSVSFLNRLGQEVKKLPSSQVKVQGLETFSISAENERSSWDGINQVRLPRSSRSVPEATILPGEGGASLRSICIGVQTGTECKGIHVDF